MPRSASPLSSPGASNEFSSAASCSRRQRGSQSQHSDMRTERTARACQESAENGSAISADKPTKKATDFIIIAAGHLAASLFQPDCSAFAVRVDVLHARKTMRHVRSRHGSKRRNICTCSARIIFDGDTIACRANPGHFFRRS